MCYQNHRTYYFVLEDIGENKLVNFGENLRLIVLLTFRNIFSSIRRSYWWGGVLNFSQHVTAFNQSDYSIDQSNRGNAVMCQNKLKTPPHQYRRPYCSNIKDIGLQLAMLMGHFTSLIEAYL